MHDFGVWGLKNSLGTLGPKKTDQAISPEP